MEGSTTLKGSISEANFMMLWPHYERQQWATETVNLVCGRPGNFITCSDVS